jgi:flagellar basal-body rod protein FlgB
MNDVATGNRILSRLMSAATVRDRVLAENIANQNVPGYQRRVVGFEDVLRQRILGNRAHDDVVPQVTIDTTTPAGPDGNNVSLELETNAMRENRIAYELYATMLQSRLGLQQAAITESR